MKANILNVIVIAVGMLFCLSSFSIEQRGPKWEKLGTQKVNRGLDHDAIFVTAKEGSFKKLKFIVKRSGINMHKLVVHFANGETQVVETRDNVARGGESRVIDLEGNNRIITKVDFWYDSKGGLLNDKAVIELWGRK